MFYENDQVMRKYINGLWINSKFDDKKVKKFDLY